MTKKVIIVLAILIFTACSQKTNEKITDISQLKDKRICVLTGSAGDIAVRYVFPNAKFIDLVAATDAAYNVKIGKADAFVFDRSVLLKIVKKEPGLKVLDEPVSQVEIAIALNKERTGLLAEINNALEILKNDGTLKAMKVKWVDSEYQTMPELPGIQAESPNGTLKMGTCATVEPMTFVYNNNITGFDIELSQRLSKLLGKKIGIVDMSFESLVPALQSGKIDFALSNFM